MQLRGLIEQTASAFEAAEAADGLFYGHGTDNAWDEACWLVLSALNLPFDIEPEQLPPITLEQQAQVEHLAQRRIQERIPVAYLTGEAWFCGQPYFVTPDTLIPRSPIGEFIQTLCAPWIESGRVERVLDIGTGSGCIAMAAAMAFPEAQVDAVDISDAALAVAARNKARHGLAQVSLYAGSLYAPLPAGVQYDVILSNPPYVPDTEMATLPAEYRHEPTLALRADDDGLLLAVQILQQAKDYLKPGGIIVLEVGNSADALHERLSQVPFTWLDFASGGDGVALLTYEQVLAC